MTTRRQLPLKYIRKTYLPFLETTGLVVSLSKGYIKDGSSYHSQSVLTPHLLGMCFALTEPSVGRKCLTAAHRLATTEQSVARSWARSISAAAVMGSPPSGMDGISSGRSHPANMACCSTESENDEGSLGQEIGVSITRQLTAARSSSRRTRRRLRQGRRRMRPHQGPNPMGGIRSRAAETL
jgi:hypothetical protein